MRKDSDRAITPAAEVVHVPAHLVLPGSLQAKQLFHLHTQLSLGQSFHRQKSLTSMLTVSLWSCLTLQPCELWPARLQSGTVLQARILECIGQYWLPYPSRALYFMLSWLPTPLSPWCCQSPCNPSSCTTSTRGPHWGTPRSSRAASEAKPSGLATCRDGKKTTIETQGQCG